MCCAGRCYLGVQLPSRVVERTRCCGGRSVGSVRAVCVHASTNLDRGTRVDRGPGWQDNARPVLLLVGRTRAGHFVHVPVRQQRRARGVRRVADTDEGTPAQDCCGPHSCWQEGRVDTACEHPVGRLHVRSGGHKAPTQAPTTDRWTVGS